MLLPLTPTTGKSIFTSTNNPKPRPVGEPELKPTLNLKSTIVFLFFFFWGMGRTTTPSSRPLAVETLLCCLPPTAANWHALAGSAPGPLLLTTGVTGNLHRAYGAAVGFRADDAGQYLRSRGRDMMQSLGRTIRHDASNDPHDIGGAGHIDERGGGTRGGEWETEDGTALTMAPVISSLEEGLQEVLWQWIRAAYTDDDQGDVRVEVCVVKQVIFFQTTFSPKTRTRTRTLTLTRYMYTLNADGMYWSYGMLADRFGLRV